MSELMKPRCRVCTFNSPARRNSGFTVVVSQFALPCRRFDRQRSPRPCSDRNTGRLRSVIRFGLCGFLSIEEAVPLGVELCDAVTPGQVLDR